MTISIFTMYRSASRIVPALLAAAVHVSPAGGAEIADANVCAEDYALCSAALCQPLSGDRDHVACRCEGPFRGLNVGHSSCKARTQVLTSTFSVENQFVTPLQKPLHLTQCLGPDAGRWADCLDAPCTTESGAVTCTCPVKTSEFFFIGGRCADNAADQKSICSTIRSGALVHHNNQELIGSFYGDPPKPLTCPAIR